MNAGISELNTDEWVWTGLPTPLLPLHPLLPLLSLSREAPRHAIFSPKILHKTKKE